MAKKEHLYWYRMWLPHFDQPGMYQSITFRLKDSLPDHVIRMLRTEAKEHKDQHRLHVYDDLYNAGHGECLLRRPELAEIVEQSLQFYHGEHYDLIAWCIMPNHVHVLAKMRAGYPLGTIVGAWKGFTAKQINKKLGRHGPVWYREYFDRYIRNETHFWAVVDYIQQNPVKAGLVRDAEDWPFGSARFGRLTHEDVFG